MPTAFIPVLVLIFVMSPRGLGAQQPETVTSAQAASSVGQVSQGPLTADETRQRPEAQARAQLELLRLQRRQLAEQGNDQIRQLKEQAAEQIEQAQAEANRQIQQFKTQVNRQIQQVQSQIKRQAELLEAQMKIIEAQAGIPAEPTRVLKRVDRANERVRGRSSEAKAPPVVSSKLGQRLERLLDRLEGLEKRLDAIERKK